MSTGVALSISVLLIAINGFFVAVELAFVASRRTKLETMAEEGARGAAAAVVATSDVTRMLFAAQLGITVASLLLGLIAEQAVAHVIESTIEAVVDVPEGVLHTIGFAMALLFVVFVHTVFGEMVPKNIAIAQPERSSRFLAPLHLVVVTVVQPIIWFLKLLARPLLRLAGIDPDAGLNDAHTPEELLRLIDASRRGGLVDEHEHALLAGALDFGESRVRSIMIPRDELATVSRGATVREIEAQVVRTGHSRFPVVGTDAGSIIGFVHAKDLVRLPADALDEPVPLELIRRMLQVTIERKLEDVMLDMKRQRTHMALVVAADARPVGMITLEDILEELVGDIFDESDQTVSD